MGEIAEMMLDGTLCEACGSYMGDQHAPGFPQYCSPQCARDRGAEPERDDRPKLNWLRVKAEADLARIAGWLKQQRVNTCAGPKTDRKGDWIILLGWDDKPDSDWGKFRGNRAAVWFATEALARAGMEAIEKAWAK